MMKKLLDVLIAIIVLPIYLAILLIKMVFVAFRYLLGLLMGLVVLTFWSVILFPPTGGHDIAYQSHDIDQKCRVSVPATTEPAGKQAVKSRPEDTQLNSYLCPVLLKIHRPQGALTLLQGQNDFNARCPDAELATSYPHCRVNFPTGLDQFTVHDCTMWRSR